MTWAKIETVKQSKEGEKIKVTAKFTDATKGGWLYFRTDKSFAFKRTPMFDDGTNGDAAANDAVFTVLVDTAKMKGHNLSTFVQ